MATWLFKDGQKQLFEADRVSNQIKNGGWSPVDPNAKVVAHAETIIPAGLISKNETDAKAEILNLMGIRPKDSPPPILKVTSQAADPKQKRQYTRRKQA